MHKDITALFCFVDDFVKLYESILNQKAITNTNAHKPTRTPGLSTSEIITIILMFQISPAKNFKYFYESYLPSYDQNEFNKLPSYSRFITLKQRVFPILVAMLSFLLTSGCDLAYIDASSLAVCDVKRINSNKVFQGFAKIGKTTKGWFYGLKLHLMVSDKGELVNVAITAGNVDDRNPLINMTKKFKGILCGDKGYISSSLFKQLFAKGIKLVTNIKKGMKNTLMNLHEKMVLKKRSLVETVFGYLKETMQLEHTRHRCITNACIHIVSTLIMYQRKNKKPSTYFAHMLPA